MSNIEDATFKILIKIQDDISSFRNSVAGFHASIEERLDRLEDINRKQRRDSAGMLVMMRATAGDFDARVTEIEERMDAFESSTSRN